MLEIQIIRQYHSVELNSQSSTSYQMEIFQKSVTNTECAPIGCSVFQSSFPLLCIAGGFNLATCQGVLANSKSEGGPVNQREGQIITEYLAVLWKAGLNVKLHIQVTYTLTEKGLTPWTKATFTFALEIRQIQCTCLNLMLVQCTRPCGPWALNASKFSARALDLSYFTRKSKCTFINL